jgi:antitoxin component of RelBE/YafQ-DinJ toxin-antitoxin module
MVHIRVDQETKQRGQWAGHRVLSLPDESQQSALPPSSDFVCAVRMLLVHPATEKELLFEAKVPNATTVEAIHAAERGQGKRLNSSKLLFKSLGI